MLTPTEIIDMYEDYVLEQLAKQQELLNAQHEAVVALLSEIHALHTQHRLCPLERFNAWRTLPDTAADLAAWPTDTWQAKMRFTQTYLEWLRGTHATLLALAQELAQK